MEIQAFCEIYNRPIHIYSYSTGAALVQLLDFDLSHNFVLKRLVF